MDSPAMQLELSAELTGVRQYIAGGAIPIQVTLRNTGSTASMVEDKEAESPFLYTFIAGDGSRQTVSAADFTHRVFLDPPPPVAPRMGALAAGQVRTWNEDPIEYAITPPVVGEYKLAVSYQNQGQTYQAPALPVTIAAPRPVALAVAFSGDGSRLGSLLIDRASDGTGTVYRREGRDNNAAVGVQYLLAPNVVLPASMGAGAAVSTETAATYPYRWFAWLSGDQIQIAQAWDRSTLFTTPGKPSGLHGSYLIPVGWGLDKSTVMFMIAGLDDSGRAKIRTATLAARAGPLLGPVADLSERMPHQIVAGAVASPGGKLLIHLVWTETSESGQTRVMTRAYESNGQPAGEAHLLVDKPLPVLAMAIPPVVRENTAVASVHILLGGEKTRAVRALLAPAKLEAGFEVERLPDKNVKVTSWAIEAGSWPPHIAAGTAHEVLVTVPGQAPWKILSESDAPSFLRIQKAAHPWLVWADQKQGIRYMSLR